MFASLDLYGQDHTPPFLQKKEMFKKVSRRKQTIVFEFINLMVKLIDPEVDTFHILDPLVKQCAVTLGDKIEVIYFKIHSPSLLKILKTLTQNYEIVIFTILPRRIMKAIYDAVPTLE
jgi:hypothetical protein